MFAPRLFLFIWVFVLLAAVGVACGGGDLPEAPPVAQEGATAQRQETQQVAGAENQPDRASQPAQAGEPGEAGGDEQAGGEASQAAQPGSDAERQERPRRVAEGPIVAPQPYDAEYTLEILRTLAGEIGARFNGEPGERATVDFLAAELRDMGYEVSVEAFDFEFVSDRVSVSIGGAESVMGVAMDRSGQSGASGPLVSVGGVGAPGDFAAAAVDGAIAVVARGSLRFTAKLNNAVGAGAVGLIVVNTEDQLYTGRLEADSDVPVLGVSLSDGERLRRLAGEQATIAGSGGSQRSSWNVVARQPGGECRVVVGGHYDTVPNVTGANDNASGTATVVGLARAWAAAESAIDVCFVGFGAEELGLFGSLAFVDASRDSGRLSEITAMLNLDAFGDGNRPLMAVGDAELTAIAEAIGTHLEIAVEAGGLPAFVGSDHLAFMRVGVPVIFPTAFGAALHVPSDNLANIDEALLRDVGIVAHAMLECLLERAGSAIEPRVSCDAGQP